MERKPLSPTASTTHSEGISPSSPGRPSSSPATKTPISSSGMICLVKSQLCSAHLRSSLRRVAISISPMIPTAKASSGTPGTNRAASTTAPASTAT